MSIVDEPARHDLYRGVEELLGESRIRSYLDRALRVQTRTLMLGMVGAMFTMTSLCLGALTLTT